MAHDSPPPTEAHTDLGHLASAVGHHVINAFSAIVSNAELLRLSAQMQTPADPLAIADVIIKTGVEAAAVARQLINVTRPVTIIGEATVALHELAAEVVASERAAGRSGVIWEEDLRPVPPIRGNAAQLRAMLGHLIANAYEATPPQGGTITVSTGLDDRGWVALMICDSGRGMPPDVAERAVEPFFTTKKGRPGVGLSIANGIWRRHRGTLAVSSRPGEGACVRLWVDPVEGGPR